MIGDRTWKRGHSIQNLGKNKMFCVMFCLHHSFFAACARAASLSFFWTHKW